MEGLESQNRRANKELGVRKRMLTYLEMFVAEKVVNADSDTTRRKIIVRANILKNQLKSIEDDSEASKMVRNFTKKSFD